MPSLESAVAATLPHVPTWILRRLADRYIAGETLLEALERLSSLAAQGYPGILDLLGEDVVDDVHARAVAEDYIRAARAVALRGLSSYVSIKPTHMGLRISEGLCIELYRRVLAACRELELFVRVEMEDHTTTDATLRVFETLRKEFDNVGIVLQSRLLRTPSDIERLAPGPLSVRMVKGIYLEPSLIAHVDAGAIRRAFLECTRLLLERDAQVHYATHDDVLADQLIELTRELRGADASCSFQVLLGVREKLWASWKDAGHEVRVYVPFGPEWKPYSVRRMKKNPQILRHVMRNTLSLGS